MKPIIKWPGGKAGEYKKIAGLIPDYRRYIEPFFGGGGVFFQEEPGRAAVNDYNAQLVEFYRLVKEGNKSFQSCLRDIQQAWDGLGAVWKYLSPELGQIYSDY
ncbi:MAG: DNA adenine methylase, partial [Halanaerobium sp.]|nr:DNA adenine methylase [Halanaerobium sp.]